jgi:hypothetical protein
VGTLEIDTLACGVGGEQHLDFRVVEKALLCLAALLPAQAPMDQNYPLRAAKQGANSMFEVVEGVAVLGEDDEFLPR